MLIHFHLPALFLDTHKSYAFHSLFRQVFDKSFYHPIDHRRKALISVDFLHPKCVDKSNYLYINTLAILTAVFVCIILYL